MFLLAFYFKLEDDAILRRKTVASSSCDGDNKIKYGLIWTQ
jgi:hypothetical protein